MGAQELLCLIISMNSICLINKKGGRLALTPRHDRLATQNQPSQD